MSKHRTKFIITTKGDPELGDFGQTAEVYVWIPPAISDSDPDHFEHTQSELQATFAKLWDDPAVKVEVAPFQVTAAYEIKPNPTDSSRGALHVTIHVNGEPGQGLQIMSGPLAEIEQFVAGEIDQEEVRRRWGFQERS